MRHVPEGVQAQAPPDGAQAPAQRREAVPVPEVSEALLALGLVQPAHEPPLLLLPTVPGQLLSGRAPTDQTSTATDNDPRAGNIRRTGGKRTRPTNLATTGRAALPRVRFLTKRFYGFLRGDGSARVFIHSSMRCCLTRRR